MDNTGINDARAAQSGENNTATLTQIGSTAVTASIDQTGTRNTATVTQNGSMDATATVVQNGDGNIANVTQPGGTADVLQMGADNIANVTGNARRDLAEWPGQRGIDGSVDNA